VPRLREFLTLLRRSACAAFEFRHQSCSTRRLFGLLRDHQWRWCIAEAEEDRRFLSLATADWGYLRLRRPDYGAAELKGVGQASAGTRLARCVSCSFKHEDEGKGPQMAKRFLELAA